MIDAHIHHEGWGVQPVLFDVNGLEVGSYPFFVLLGLIFGILVYFLEARKKKTLSENTFFIFIAAIVGGAVGAKLPIWIMNFKHIIASLPDIRPLLTGRTIVGGMIGGTLSVLWIKKKLGINEKKGNLFAPAIALGVSIGRIGCFLRGCCYGAASNLPWAVDLGDGVLRHPTQIYEAIFMFGVFVYFMMIKNKVTVPGIMFKYFLNYYFVFRFFIEFIRVSNTVYFGLTSFQLASIAVLIYVNRAVFVRNKSISTA
ncbi:MAG: prolipoprotein diacylglyceryl transferase [Candidatus Omnitrophica bacterium]|nr:prolipoprotein diacylglyceryl transferase [Candidatus Omnitrophota bacterium]MBU1995630.1 prolipoprotein diacylglyceryl transferase [Candidatus Omnitrophota bacterium]